jgi:hypothetical protein
MSWEYALMADATASSTTVDLRIPHVDFKHLLMKTAEKLRDQARMTYRTCRRTRADDLHLDWDGDGTGTSTVTRVERTDASLKAPWARMKVVHSTLPLHAFPCALEELRDVMAVGTIAFALPDASTTIFFEQQGFEDGSQPVFRVYVRSRTHEQAEQACIIVTGGAATGDDDSFAQRAPEKVKRYRDNKSAHRAVDQDPELDELRAMLRGSKR